MQVEARLEDVYRFFEGFIMTSHPVMEAKDVRGSPPGVLHLPSPGSLTKAQVLRAARSWRRNTRPLTLFVT